MDRNGGSCAATMPLKIVTTANATMILRGQAVMRGLSYKHFSKTVWIKCP
jgi:hypothetical protein